jgi:hypothetical protein
VRTEGDGSIWSGPILIAVSSFVVHGRLIRGSTLGVLGPSGGQNEHSHNSAFVVLRVLLAAMAAVATLPLLLQRKLLVWYARSASFVL